MKIHNEQGKNGRSKTHRRILLALAPCVFLRPKVVCPPSKRHFLGFKYNLGCVRGRSNQSKLGLENWSVRPVGLRREEAD